MIYWIYGFNMPNIRKIMKHHLNISKSLKVDALIGIYHYISLPNIIQQHLSSTEKNQVIFVDGPSVVVKSDPPRSFTFDGVLGETSTQQVGVRAGIFWGWDCSLSCWKSHISTILLWLLSEILGFSPRICSFFWLKPMQSWSAHNDNTGLMWGWRGVVEVNIAGWSEYCRGSKSRLLCEPQNRSWSM